MSLDRLLKVLLACLILAFPSCFIDSNISSSNSSLNPEPIKGLTLVAPPKPFEQNPMDHVTEVHANWIAVVPYAYTPGGQAEVRHNLSNWQWWGETSTGVLETIRLAKQANIQVMLKPQVWSHHWWTGEYDFASEEEWLRWESEYEKYILHYAQMADSLSVPIFCIGTEFKISVQKRPEFWQQLIEKVRAQYTGTLTYAANWDNFQYIPFWNQLDVIGINAYFPLLDEKTPDVKTLVEAWQSPKTAIRDFQAKINKPVIFTEYGYLSVDACAHKTWELESRIHDLSINELAQANALEALYTTFWNEPYWQGGFLWKWFPNMQGHEGYPEKDYTPQGKLAEKILMTWFRGE